MPRELSVSYNGTGAALYVVARLVSDGTAWSVTNAALETYSAASLADYAIDLTDDGGDLYVGDLPAALPAGDYRLFYYERAGASPAASDLILKSPVRHWDGAALSDAGDVVLSAYALTTLESVKRRLEIDDTSADTVLTEIINGVSAEIERVTGVKFKARDYRQWLNGNNQREICLPHYPVQHLTRVAWGAANALSVAYNGSGIRASATVYKDPESGDAGGLRLVSVSTAGVPTATDLSFATYRSVSAVADAVNLVAGWSATVVQNVPSLDVVPVAGGDATGRSVFFQYPDVDEYAYSLDAESGRLRFDQYGAGNAPWAWTTDQEPGVQGWRTPMHMPRGFQHVLVEYRAGWEAIPADVQLVANKLVADAYYESQIGKGVSEIKLGPSTLKLSDGWENTIRADLAHYMDLSRMIGGV
jgi:hypothetical protein